jgi:hypothetical protein
MSHKHDEQFIRDIIERVLAEKYPSINDIELTPDPTRVKPRLYTRTTLTIDNELWKLVQSECDRLKILPPKLIDSLLWHYFKKPTLSYQCYFSHSMNTKGEIFS